MELLRSECENQDSFVEAFAFAEECANGDLQDFKDAHFLCVYCEGWYEYDPPEGEGGSQHECDYDWRTPYHENLYDACVAVRDAERREYKAALAQ